jgi:ADP-dependent NAD(P)H-hydrate dehydratase / NAD(P)H-hydrate epimerase
VLVVAGRVGTAGAAALAGRGALAAGAGLVTVAVPEPVRAEVAALHPALMTVGLPADADGGLHADAVHALPLDGVDAVVAGPGLGTGRGAAVVVTHLRARCARLVLDADALNVHRDAPDTLGEHPRGAGAALVLTPHERELDRLAGDGAHRDRVARLPALAARWDAHVVAKGPGTLSVAPDGTVHVSPFSVPALATGGTGDVLAGMLGATLAADGGDDVARRVARAVWWHAAAGVLAGARSGGRTDATGVLDALPHLFAHLAAAGGTALRSRDPGPMGRIVVADLLLEPSEVR